jgi:hypothetical protein
VEQAEQVSAGVGAAQKFSDLTEIPPGVVGPAKAAKMSERVEN